MDGKFLSKNTTKNLIDFFYKLLKKTVPFIFWPLIKPVLGLGVNLLNKFGDKNVPDSVDIYINNSLNLMFENAWEEAATEVAIALDVLVDIKNLDPEKERSVSIIVSQAIVNIIQNWIRNKKEDGNG